MHIYFLKQKVSGIMRKQKLHPKHIQLRTDDSIPIGVPTIPAKLLRRANRQIPRLSKKHVKRTRRRPRWYWTTQEGLNEAQNKLNKFKNKRGRDPTWKELKKIVGAFLNAQAKQGRKCPEIRDLLGGIARSKSGPRKGQVKTEKVERNASIVRLRTKRKLTLDKLASRFKISRARVGEILSEAGAPKMNMWRIRAEKRRKIVVKMHIKKRPIAEIARKTELKEKTVTDIIKVAAKKAKNL